MNASGLPPDIKTVDIQSLLDILQPVQRATGTEHNPPDGSPSHTAPSSREQQHSEPSPIPDVSSRISDLLATLQAIPTLPLSQPDSSTSLGLGPGSYLAPPAFSLPTHNGIDEEYDPNSSESGYKPLSHLSTNYYLSRPTAVPSYHPPFEPSYQATNDPSFFESSSFNHEPEERGNSDLSSLTFAQALPYLVRLSEDSHVMSQLQQIKADQNELERSLWAERQRLIEEHRKGVAKAQTTALLVGHRSIPPFEQKALAQKLEAALKRFHSTRVLPEWDSHVKKQQRALEALGVPTMGLVAEGDRARREKQGRVVGALEGMIGEG